MMIKGSFDVVTTREALGWAYEVAHREPVLVQAVLNQEVLGEALANKHRPDLAQAGIGNGNAGFAIRFFRPIDPLYLPFISCKVDGGDTELPRAPLAGFKEFFSALNHSHPAAGRHRACLGGLWTDRTDAATLVTSKTRIGALAADLAPFVEALIHHGNAVIPSPLPHANQNWRDNLSFHIGEFLEHASILPLLRAVLEDNPMVVTAEWIEQSQAQFSQASVRNPSPSPGECVDIVLAIGEGVGLEIIRGSHAMPEFDINGKSRWTRGEVMVADGMARAMGLVDRVAVPDGMAALVGPGTINKINLEQGAMALRLHCLPVRGRTVAMATAGVELSLNSGVMVLV